MKRYLLLVLILIAPLLISGCDIASKYEVSEDGYTIHSKLTGRDYSIPVVLSTISKKYTEEEILKYMDGGKESIERLKRYKNGTWTMEDIHSSVHVIMDLYIRAR